MDRNTHYRNDAKSEYFKLPHPVTMIAVTFGLGLTALCYYCPDSVPYTYLGPLGMLARYLAVDHAGVLKGIWYFAIICHSGEAVYSLSVSSAKELEPVTKLKWFISTLCFGVCSLKLLTAYTPLKS